MKKVYLILILACLFSCKNDQTKFLTETVPAEKPLLFKEELTPKNKLIHKGIFSPDFKNYYYTLSNKDYSQFDVYVIEKRKGDWSIPEKAFFNSEYNDHGMSFSPDGNMLYFSSTRPTNVEGVAKTWHIWKSEKSNGKWSKPVYVDIPNLRDKVVSHPILTNAGNLYFHASNLDYSKMDIYHSKNNNGTFGKAQKVLMATNLNGDKCTPYVSYDEEYMLFATVGNQLDLYISFNDGTGNWSNPKKLNSTINTSGKGNPFVTPDHKYLFYTTGNHQGTHWNVKWVDIASELKKK